MPKDKNGKEVAEVNPIQKDELYNMYNINTKAGGLPEQHSPIAPEDDVEEGDESGLDENGLPIEPLDDNVPELPETLTDDQVQQLLKLPDAKLIEYGIDDPKQWKNYQRALTKANIELKQLRSQMQPQLNPEIEMLKKQIAELKTPVQRPEPVKAPIPPQMPQRPANFNWANIGIEGSAEMNYMQAKDAFDEKQYHYQMDLANYNATLLSSVSNTLNEERQTRAQEQQMSAIRTDGIGRLMKSGLNAIEAQEAWDMATNPQKMQSFYSPENIGALYKIQKGGTPINNKGNRFDRNKRNRENFLPPGVSGGRGESVHPNEFSKSTDHTNMYATKKG